MLLFLGTLYDIENLRTSFCLFCSLSFSFIVICSRATLIWHQSIISIRDQVIYVCFKFLFCFFRIVHCLPKFLSSCRIKKITLTIKEMPQANEL